MKSNRRVKAKMPRAPHQNIEAAGVGSLRAGGSLAQSERTIFRQTLLFPLSSAQK